MRLLQLLSKVGIDSKDVRLIQASHYEQTANVKIGNNITGEAQIKKDVQQGCALSPNLVNLYCESILHGINKFEEIKVESISTAYVTLMTLSSFQRHKGSYTIC